MNSGIARSCWVFLLCLVALVAGCGPGDSSTDLPTRDVGEVAPDPSGNPDVPGADVQDTALTDPGLPGDAPDSGQPEVPVPPDTTSPDPATDGDASPGDPGADIGPFPACHASVPLRCGDRIRGGTAAVGVPDEWNGYDCSARLESGPESLLAIGTDRDCQVALRLADLDADLDLFVLESCDPFTCSANSSLPRDIQDIRGVESVEIFQKSGQFRFVAVDGYDDAAGAFTLEADCLCGSGAAGFGDGSWQMKVDRRWNHAPTSGQFPLDLLDEKDYEPVEDGPTYRVVVSDGWRHVSVGSEPLLGESQPDTDGSLWYDLSEGTFAGGRFRIWTTPNGLQAERTLYGSGVPIVISERGSLTPIPE